MLVGIRNNDGHNYDSVGLGDLQQSLSFQVSDGRLPPVPTEVVVKVNGVPTANRSFSPGDSISIEAIASDPNSLPLEYMFQRFRNCSGDSVVQNWSSSNSLNYTFQAADVTNCTIMFIGVRNNDGIDFDSTAMGDMQMQVQFNVSDGRLPPTISSLDVLVSNAVSPNRSFHVGDTITVRANASDPNSLPIEYFFMVFRSCGGTSDTQSFSSSNEFTYTFTSADVTSCTSIFVGAKNNDGIDMDSSTFGDVQSSISYDVSF
jgi:hypothetical protein